jgi:hypothetical protein
MDCLGDGVFPAPMALHASMTADGPASFWLASDHTQGRVTGPLSWTAPFQKTPNSTTWSFFMDGVADVTLYGTDPYTWCNVTSSPTTNITEAVLLLDAEFPIAVEPSTWGRVKALYR